MWKPTGGEKLYKITKPGAKYARVEDRNGKAFNALYTGFDARNAHLPSEVLLTEKAAIALKHLRLVPTGRERPSVTIKSDEPAAPAAFTVDEANPIVIPEDWDTLPAASRRALAEQISMSDVPNAKTADKIIEEHLRGNANAS